MSKRRPNSSSRKSTKSQAQTPSKRSSESATTATGASRQKSQSAATTRRSPLPLIGGLIVALVSGLVLVFWRASSINGISANSSSELNITVTAIAQLATPATYTVGDVRYCTGVLPPFAAAQGFSTQVFVDTRSRNVKGVRLIEFDQNNQPLRVYQHPSWTSAGYLGPQVTDRFGSIYLAPVPFVNILDNPPEKANIIYKIDANSGEMTPLVNLPAARPPSTDNVYGLLGVAYDCDTHSLYATSVLGSTRDRELGRIFRVDLRTGQVASILDGVDAFGTAIFNSTKGKRLYFGRARAADLVSVALDNDGNFSGDMRVEFSFAGHGISADERARAVQFRGKDQLVLQITQFDFNLVAPTESLQTGLEYRYDSADDTWRLVNIYPVEN